MRSIVCARAITIAAIVGGIAACSHDATAPQPPSERSSDLVASGDPVGILMGTAGQTATGRSGGAGAADQHAHCTYDTSIGRFTCPAVTHHGVTRVTSFAFFDAAGLPQDHYDEQTTASVNTQITEDGTTDGDHHTATIHRHGEMTASGLAGTETSRTLNGTEEGTVDAQMATPHGSVHSVMHSADTTSGLVLPIVSRDAHASDTGQPHWPLAGSVVHVRSGTITRDNGESHTVSHREKLTFDGTGTVTVEITRPDGSTQTCTRDMQAHTRSCTP